MNSNYKKLLKRAREKIPEEIYQESRFKAPKAEVLIQGNKTIIKNFSSICKTLRRDKESVSKFLIKEIGTAGTVENGFLKLNGNFSEKRINEKLEEYINTFVLCRECKKPDTQLKRDKGVLILKCEACGARYPVQSSK